MGGMLAVLSANGAAAKERKTKQFDLALTVDPLGDLDAITTKPAIAFQGKHSRLLNV